MPDKKPSEPSPEVKKILRNFCDIQRGKYGDDWKEKLSHEMAEKTAPFINALLKLQKK